MQTWVDIITDPHHIFADFLMNLVYEVIVALITYKLIIKRIIKKIEEKVDRNN